MINDREHQSSNNNVINQNELDQFMEKVLTDLGGAASTVLVYVMDKLGYCKAMSDAGRPITTQELSVMTKTSESNTRKWLANPEVTRMLRYPLLPENLLNLRYLDSSSHTGEIHLTDLNLQPLYYSVYLLSHEMPLSIPIC